MKKLLNNRSLFSGLYGVLSGAVQWLASQASFNEVRDIEEKKYRELHDMRLDLRPF